MHPPPTSIQHFVVARHRPRPWIVIAEDDHASRHALVGLLLDEGYLVDAAADGAEALRLCQVGVPDLLLTDLHMPRLSGAALIESLRAREPSLEIGVLSGDVPFDAGRRAVGLGARQYFIKPLELEDILAWVRRVVGLPTA